MSELAVHVPATREQDIRIAAYQDSMRSQVGALISSQYGGAPEERERSFVRFYEHPFQRDRCVRLVALDGERVVGFQAFFYWPYLFGDQRLASFQSGSSIVASDYRGRGIFGRLLAALAQRREFEGIDLIMGFPVKQSFGSFTRDGYAHPLDLSWYARLINPASVMFPLDSAVVDIGFEQVAEPMGEYRPANTCVLANDPDFLEWRRHYRDAAAYRYFHHSSALGRVRFDVRCNRRGRITELIIGDVASTKPDAALLEAGLRDLIKAARAQRFVTVLTIALNRSCRDRALLQCLRKCLFVRLRPKIRFIVKNLRAPCNVEDPSCWRLFRGDLDTW
jgi:GNAT superfamily N-acetyltransferase